MNHVMRRRKPNLVSKAGFIFVLPSGTLLLRRLQFILEYAVLGFKILNDFLLLPV